MGSKDLKQFKKIALDSNIFSYQFHQHPIFGPSAKSIFDHLSANQLQAVTSSITLVEVLSVKAPLPKIKQLEQLLLLVPNLVVYDVDRNIAVEAAKIRREYGFRAPDAIQLATAKLAKVKVFITNDQKLKRYKKLKVILISEI